MSNDADKLVTELINNLSNVAQELMSEDCKWSKHTITVELPDPLFNVFDSANLSPEEVKEAIQNFVNSTIRNTLLVNMTKVQDLADSIKDVSIEKLMPGFSELIEEMKEEMEGLNDKISQFDGVTKNNFGSKNTKNSS